MNMSLLVNSRHPDPRRVWKGGPQQRVMTPLPGIPGILGIPGDWGGRVPKSLFWNSAPSLSLTFAVRAPPPGAAAGAGAEFREASFGATLLHFC